MCLTAIAYREFLTVVDPILGSTRFCLAIIAFLGMMNLYALRINMSLAIVCMVNHTAVQAEVIISPDGENITYIEDDSMCYNTVLNSTKKVVFFQWLQI